MPAGQLPWIEGPPIDCPLCQSSETELFCEDQARRYFRCVCCHLTFVPAVQHVSRSVEKTHYDFHQNSPDDAGYRRFLGRMFDPLQAALPPASSGLDFGCGPGPTLSVMFQEAGHTMSVYDPYYFADTTPLQSIYDFVTCTEVVEHFRNPRMNLDLLWGRVKPGGMLGIMTKLVIDAPSFANWHYKIDPTHISFFSRKTFQWLADAWRAELEFVGADVMLLCKPL